MMFGIRLVTDELQKKVFASVKKKEYQYISDLEKMAEDKKIEICEAFQGKIIEGQLEILSPSKEFYLELMIESNKTPLEKSNVHESAARKIVNKLVQYVKNLIESWTDENLEKMLKLHRRMK